MQGFFGQTFGKDGRLGAFFDLLKDDKGKGLFKKLAKQGGICRIGGLRWIIKVSDKVVDSKGYKDKGVGITPGPEKS